MAAVVFVHGAFHGGWCWGRLTPLVEAAGHQVWTPTLTGLGERSHLASSSVGLQTHIDDIATVLKREDLHGVALVGHSYAGLVITGVADLLPERLSSLVYLDASFPEAGEANVDYLPPAARERLLAGARSEGWTLPSPDPTAFGVRDEDDLAWMRPRMTPQPVNTFLDRLPPPGDGGAGLRRHFILCRGEDGRAMMRRHADRARSVGVTVHELTAAHDVMVTAPQEVASLLLGRVIAAVATA